MKHHKKKTNLRKILGVLVAPLMLGLSVLMTGGAHAATYNISVDKNHTPDLIRAGSFIAYCIEHNVHLPETGEYFDSPKTVANFAQMAALAARAYPVYSGPALGIIYLNDASITNLQAQQATQAAIWTIENPAGAGTFSSDAKVNALAAAMIANTPSLNSTWVTVDKSGATITNVGDTRSSYGPIKITTNTGNTNLDAAIRSAGFTFSPRTGSRNPDFTFSLSSAVDGAEAATITDGSYYINYSNADGVDTTLSIHNSIIERQQFSSFDVADTLPDLDGTIYQLIGIVKAVPISDPSAIVLINGEEEPEMCEWDPTLPVDDPGCQPPEEVCEFDPTLPADDPNCAPEVPETGHISDNPTLIASGIALVSSAVAIISVFVVNRIKTQRATRTAKITHIRRK